MKPTTGRPGGSVALVRKAAGSDPVGTIELVRYALYEVFEDLADESEPVLGPVFAKAERQVRSSTRRVLVREAIAKRMDGLSIDALGSAAASVGLLEVSKDTTDDSGTKYWDARDSKGRFRRLLDRAAAFSGDKKQQGAVLGAAERIVRPSDGADRQAYRRLAVAGTALGAAAGAGTAAAAVGAVSQLAGELGPEAERVLGPSIRRTAYRYRGTEKRPDRGLVTGVKEAGKLAGGVTSSQTRTVTSGTKDRAALTRGLTIAQGALAASKDPVERRQLQQDVARYERAIAANRPQTKEIAVSDSARDQVRAGLGGQAPSSYGSVAVHMETKGLSPDQVRLRSQGDVAAAYLIGRLPTPERTDISIAAGRVPPSQGVIIDADGDVVAESLGVNGDHYLPFDLRNLRELDGGQYVRTRAAGGPTGEDIYTGLLSNSRQVQVVSNSGVFTLEFDPDLRGGRRFSDKARQMVSRYQAILEVIRDSKKHQLFARDIDPKVKAGIRRQALEQAGFDEEYAKPIEDRLLERARAEASLREPEAVIEAETETRLASELQRAGRAGKRIEGRAVDRLREDISREVMESHRGDRVRRYQLDGEGYYAALQTLQEEFPYFIRSVDHQPLPSFIESRGIQGQQTRRPFNAADRNYVGRGEVLRGEPLRPARKPEQAPAQQTAAQQPPQGAQGAQAAPAAAAAPAASLSPQLARAHGVLGLAAPGQGPTLSEASKQASTKIKRRLNSLLVDASEAVEAMGLDVGRLDDPSTISDAEALSEYKPSRYAQWVLNLRAPGSKATEFALADPRAKEKLAQGLKDLSSTLRRDYGDDDRTKEYAQTLIDAAGQVESAGDLDPFQTPTSADPTLHRPSADSPKPARLRGLENLGLEDAAYSSYLEALKKENPAAAEEVGVLANEDAKAISATINEWLDEFDDAQTWAKDGFVEAKKPPGLDLDAPEARLIVDRPQETPQYERLQAVQIGWAFKTAREAAAKLRAAIGIAPSQAGGAAPFAPGQDPLRKSASPNQLLLDELFPPGSLMAELIAGALQRERSGL